MANTIISNELLELTLSRDDFFELIYYETLLKTLVQPYSVFLWQHDLIESAQLEC